MSKTRTKENDRFGWSAFSTKLKLLTFAVLGLTILMSTAHSLGIDTGDGQRGDDLVSGLLGKLLLLWVRPVKGAYTWISEARGVYGEFTNGRMFIEQSRIGGNSILTQLAISRYGSRRTTCRKP